MLKTIELQTNERIQMLDITSRIQKEILNSGVQSGLCTLFVPHTTAALTINENADPDVVRDMLQHLSELIPQHSKFRHSEGNSDAHIKASLLGFDQRVIIDQGKLVLGTWQGIYFCEFDGPRRRKLHIKIVKD